MARALSLEASPEEVLVIREALAGAGLVDSLTRRIQQALQPAGPELTDVQLRAAGVLARLDATHPLWPALASPLARKLVRENSLRIGTWRSVFQPVSRLLIRPLLEQYTAQSQADVLDRAFTLLLEFADQPENPKRAEDLAALVGMADPGRMDQVIGLLADPLERTRAVAVLITELDTLARFDERKSASQGRIAVALMRLGQASRVWPLLVQTDEPSLRTELTHDLFRYHIPATEIAARLKLETDVSARRALILALGEYPAEGIDGTERQSLTGELVRQYQVRPRSRNPRGPGMAASAMAPRRST